VRRNLARRGVVAASGFAATLAAVAALGAGTAFAQTGQAITGSGSSLQGLAQSNLSSAFNSNSSVNEGGSVSYTSTSSGDGLAVFGDAAATIGTNSFSAGVLNPGAGNGTGTATVLNAFIGSDDAPTSSLISSGETAANHGTTASIKQITLPVLQAPVAAIFSLPADVTLNTGANLKLTNALLNEIWTDTVPANSPYPANSWGALLKDAGLSGDFTESGTAGTGSAFGTGGYSEIQLVARGSGSGTTFTFRGYLNEVEDLQNVAGTLSSANWANDYNDGDVNDTDNIQTATNSAAGWPFAIRGNLYEGTESSGSLSTTSGGNLVAYVKANPGTISYANLADALSGDFRSTTGASTTAGASSGEQLIYAEVQNNGVSTSGATFVDPSSQPSTPTTKPGNVYTGTNLNTSQNIGTGNGDGFWALPAAEDGSFASTPAWGSDPFAGSPQPGEVAAANDPDVSDDVVTGPAATGDYPIVAATYDEAYSSYTTGNVDTVLADEGQNPQEVANTTSAYFNFVFSQTGRGDIATDGYQVLPSSVVDDVEQNQLPFVP
jgi:ABC-type phosphate transport system substrate-binding protein